MCQIGTYLVWGVLLATRLRITLKYYLLLCEYQAAPGEESFPISIVSPGGEVSHFSCEQRLEVLTSNPVSTNVNLRMVAFSSIGAAAHVTPYISIVFCLDLGFERTPGNPQSEFSPAAAQMVRVAA